MASLSGCAVVVGSAAAPIQSGQIAAVFNNGLNNDLNNDVDKDFAQCASILSQTDLQSASTLDPGAIDMLNWNIKKGSEENWSSDLDSYSEEMELILIQEAVHTMDVHFGEDQVRVKSFAAGYEHGDMKSGVATFSNVAPIHQCQLRAYEPWLHTPKATSITRYALKDTDETLVVVNIHMINFTLGLKHFQAQLSGIVDLLSSHQGPLIVSGDFNTWRPMREEIVRAQMERLGMQAVTFSDDRRSRFLGHPVDHIFISKLSVREATTLETDSSDHNPMAIRLALSI